MSNTCLCADLRRATRKVTAIYDDALAPLGINVAQYSLLRKIEAAEAISLTDLGRLTGLDRSTVGRNCKVLERLGVIAPVPAEDGREMCISLSRSGVATLRKAQPLWQGAQKTMNDALGAGGADSLRALLQRV